MSAFSWQDVAVALVAAGALGWLVARRVRAGRRASACEHCPAARPVPGTRPPLVVETLVNIGDPADNTSAR